MKVEKHHLEAILNQVNKEIKLGVTPFLCCISSDLFGWGFREEVFEPYLEDNFPEGDYDLEHFKRCKGDVFSGEDDRIKWLNEQIVKLTK